MWAVQIVLQSCDQSLSQKEHQPVTPGLLRALRWADPVWQLSPYSLPPCPTGWEKESESKREKNLWVKIKTAMKENEMKQPQKQSSDAMAVSHHLQPDAQPGNIPPMAEFPPVLPLKVTLYGMRCVFGQFGGAVPAVPSPNPLLQPQPAHRVAEQEMEKALTLCRHSNN